MLLTWFGFIIGLLWSVYAAEYLSIVPYHNYSYLHASNERRDQLFQQTHYRPADPIIP